MSAHDALSTNNTAISHSDMHHRMETREKLADFAEFVLYILENNPDSPLCPKLENIAASAFQRGLAVPNNRGHFTRSDQ